MKVLKQNLTQQLVQQYLAYDPISGHLTWLERPSPKIFEGDRAGSLAIATGYRTIQLFECNYKEHQLIWFLVHGIWAEIVDHINHIRDDNRLINLRAVTAAQNARNQSQRKGTITGYQGIWRCRRRNKWVAEITRDRKKVWQRTFDDIAEARLRRAEALLQHDFHENHGA